MICQNCNHEAVLVTGDRIYKNRKDLSVLNFWHCGNCDSYVGCHKEGAVYRRGGKQFVSDGTVPFGTLANFETRYARKYLHDIFDTFWKSKGWSRNKAYKWLQTKTGLCEDDCHISMMDFDVCLNAVNIVNKEAGYEPIHA